MLGTKSQKRGVHKQLVTNIPDNLDLGFTAISTTTT